MSGGRPLAVGAQARLTPAEAAETARAKALGAGLSPERAEKRAQEAADLAWIGLIADRAQAHVQANPNDFAPKDWDRTNTVILLIRVKKANPELDLKKLSESNDFNFFHDTFGILRYADRATGKLGGQFLPRTMRSGA